MSKCYYPLTAQSVEELAAIFDDFLRGAWAPLVEGGITADNLSPTLFSPALGGGPTGGTGGAGLVPVQGSEGSKYVLGIPILHRDAPGSIRQKFYQGKPAGIEFLIDSSVGDDGRICLVDYKDASKLQILSLAMSGSDGQVVANTGDLLLDATTGDVLINGVSIGDYARKSQNETITGDWTYTGDVVMSDATRLGLPVNAPASLGEGDIYWDKLGDGRIHIGGPGPVDTKVWDDGGVPKMDLSGVTGGVFLPDYNSGVGDNEIGYETGGGQLRWKYGGVTHVGWDNNNFDPTDYLTIVAAAAAYQPLDGDLTALAALATTGVMARTAANTYTMRTVTGTTGKVTVTNGDGVSGNPTITIADALDLGGNTSVEIPNGAGGTTVDAAGEVCVDTTSKTLNFYDGAAEKVLTPVMSKSITIESPGASEDLSLFFTDDAITITKIVAVLTGSSTPSVTWTVRRHTDRNNAGNEVVTSGTKTTSTTTGSVVTSFNDATVPADSFLWLETTAQSGTVTTLNVTIFYTQDA